MKPRALTKKEQSAINRVIKAFENFPSSLMIFDHSGSLTIVDAKTKQVFDNIRGVRSDGGDPQSFTIDDVEFLDTQP